MVGEEETGNLESSGDRIDDDVAEQWYQDVVKHPSLHPPEDPQALMRRVAHMADDWFGVEGNAGARAILFDTRSRVRDVESSVRFVKWLAGAAGSVATFAVGMVSWVWAARGG